MDDKYLPKIELKDEQFHPGRNPGRKQSTIFIVPRHIRESDVMAYTPRQVVIGRTNTNDLHRYKWRCMRYLLVRHGDQEQEYRLRNIIFIDNKMGESDLSEWWRRCYPGNFVGYNGVIMEGCFILYLLLREKKPQSNAGEVEVDVTGDKKSNKKPEEEEKSVIKGKNIKVETATTAAEEDVDLLMLGNQLIDMPFLWSQMKYDLLMLDNQFPFTILQKLFDLLKTPDDEDADLVDLALKFFEDLHPIKPKSKPNLPSDEIHNLLHLFHASLLPPELEQKPPTETAPSTFEWIPSATELQDAGVKFKKKKADNIFDISFAKGVLEIPPFHISNDCNIIFRNLMAFEQCFPVTPYVTAYVLCMNCIAHTPNDARLLHQSKIAQNATDEQVAVYFDRLSSKIQYPGGTNYLLPIYTEVGKYCDSKWHKWRTNLLRDYFGTPWVAASVTAATVLLILTIMQTYYAGYAYYHPSN